MGRKDWYWSTGGRGRKSSSNSKASGETHQAQIPSGCMCAVFHAFDFHPLNFTINHQQQTTPNSSSSAIQNNHTVPKGAEAPRNSLESEDGTVSSISKEEILKFPKNMRIKTSESTRTRGGSFDDISSSPGTKTPTLVARLMGLDLLPDANCSTSSSSSSCISTPKKQGHSNHHHNRTKQQQQKQHIQIMKHRHSTDSAMMRSLARRSYVEHRLSLQINKENIGLVSEDLETPPRFSFSKRKFDENNNSKSPSHYARQIVKQVKESVSRKVGLEITNTVQNREQGREEIVGQLKFMKSPKMKPLDKSSPRKQSSYSPRLSRFNDTTTDHKPSPKNQNTKVPSSPKDSVVNIEAQVPKVSTKPKAPQALSEKEVQNKKSFPKFNKTATAHGNLSSRLNKTPQTSSIKSKQDESFITRPTSTTTRGNDFKTKNKKRTHPLSTNLLNNLNTVTKIHRPSPPTKILPKQNQSQVSDVSKEAKHSTQLFSCLRQPYKQVLNNTRGNTNGESKCKDEGAEYEYITAILSRSGIHRATVPNLQFQWFSSTHPLDPSLFHRLELYPASNAHSSFTNNNKDRNFTLKNHLGPRCNRRLLFDLVDEVLSYILIRPPKRYSELLLEETVWNKVRSFPRAKCEYLEDIDGLIEMEEMKKEDEGERLMAEIEEKIVEALVHETLTAMVVS